MTPATVVPRALVLSTTQSVIHAAGCCYPTCHIALSAYRDGWGSPANVWTCSSCLSHSARSAQQICASGRRLTGLSRQLSRDRHHSAVGVDARNCRTTRAAKALLVPRSRKPKGLDQILAGFPDDCGVGRKQIGRMCGSCVLSTASAVTQKEAVNAARHLETDGATQAFATTCRAHFVNALS